ncbi:MAG: RsmB/NOP family class I SAM-dependent RNA methyltransferase [Dysgonamonadaceae bacterium]|jgi:16S rRNA C967 or C1407 C5-methylase (RsmB/RsmF family)/NOL1/NOP2/fmu family ribosome biogenesis protein|nr:RsmB/NOP family class I SAM-dependent RNA methyltransferase [Dysgonamonadaceae bacterium]
MKLPEAFISRTKALLGDEWADFEQALQGKSPVSIRLNPDKTAHFCRDGCRTDSLEKVPWASGAYYLPERPVFTLDPLFHAGCYYVQEASSMYLEQVVKKWISSPSKVLDLCAAPGGKSTQLSAVLPEKSLLVANEVIRSRAGILSENLIKWGNPHTIVTNSDPSVFGKITGFFDLILADVPCSGEGMFRKDPGSIEEWSLANVRLCAERQRRIISDCWPALKPDGLLIYSTCTYNREENEENLDWICRELGAKIVEEPRRFLPHKSKGEGFFIAGLRKNFSSCSSRNATKTSSGISPGTKAIAQMRSAFLSTIEKAWEKDEFAFFSENNTLSAIPSIHQKEYLFLKSKLKTVSAGITLGELKGKDWIPAHALAMSSRLPQSVFPEWELDKNTALTYLRKEALTNLPDELPPGYVLVTYQKQPLGFIKNVGNRGNNLYPQEWRIRMSR